MQDDRKERLISRIELDSKSLLAKLLANENVTVHFSTYAETASFSVENRTLTIPIYENLSKQLVDVFVSHEIAHALYTPTNWLSDEIIRVVSGSDDVEKHIDSVKDLLNVIEDVRIEKLLRSKYQGLWGTYRQGYRDLLHKGDFFGPMEDWATMSFRDRMNLTFKLGPLELEGVIEIPFSIEEQPIVDASFAAMTYREVVEVATLAYQQELSKGPERKSETESNSEKVKQTVSDWSGNAPPSTSKTRKIEQQFLQQQAQNNHPELVYINFSNIPIDEIVIPHDLFWKYYNDQEINNNPNSLKFNRDAIYIEFMNNNSILLNHYVTSFNKWKAARESALARPARSGEIDLNKLSSVRFDDDIFIRKSISMTAKNHGLIMYIDWSGSMHAPSGDAKVSTTTIEDTIRQTLVLCEFCRRCRIPYEVYLFTTELKVGRAGRYLASPSTPEDLKAELGIGCALSTRNEFKPYENYLPFNLVQILSGTMSGEQHRNAVKVLLEIGRSHSNDYNRTTNPWKSDNPKHKDWTPQGGLAFCDGCLRLGSTPSIGTMMVTPKIIERFQKRNNVEKIALILLTDGQPSDKIEAKKLSVVQYQSTSKVVNNGTNNPLPFMAEFVSDLCDVTIVGIYINSSSGISHLTTLVFYEENTTRMLSTTLKNKRQKLKTDLKNSGYTTMNIRGFEQFFVIPSSSLRLEKMQFDNVISSRIKKEDIVGKYSEKMQEMMQNRIFVNEFMHIIGVGH